MSQAKLWRYEVLRRDKCQDLCDAVSSYLNAGWELVGGVAVAVAWSDGAATCFTWAQAMRREVKP